MLSVASVGLLIISVSAYVAEFQSVKGSVGAPQKQLVFGHQNAEPIKDLLVAKFWSSPDSNKCDGSPSSEQTLPMNECLSDYGYTRKYQCSDGGLEYLWCSENCEICSSVEVTPRELNGVCMDSVSGLNYHYTRSWVC